MTWLSACYPALPSLGRRETLALLSDALDNNARESEIPLWINGLHGCLLSALVAGAPCVRLGRRG